MEYQGNEYHLNRFTVTEILHSFKANGLVHLHLIFRVISGFL